MDDKGEVLDNRPSKFRRQEGPQPDINPTNDMEAVPGPSRGNLPSNLSDNPPRKERLQPDVNVENASLAVPGPSWQNLPSTLYDHLPRYEGLQPDINPANVIQDVPGPSRQSAPPILYGNFPHNEGPQPVVNHTNDMQTFPPDPSGGGPLMGIFAPNDPRLPPNPYRNNNPYAIDDEEEWQSIQSIRIEDPTERLMLLGQLATVDLLMEQSRRAHREANPDVTTPYEAPEAFYLFHNKARRAIGLPSEQYT
ncbi:hypothetical protein CspeluHIS016_0407310 [Cutaneotrichosporon spelunceum]|uniref:Uncharacterized protein n=1 Tax=Cutaneotrichosporon spelunceum TaxID=1672016 RepID=A0AAD3TWV4_9TREE|nr:hypothetical protein CspeluHIS016_0407310 [Cutaneotrichosporon spelunceum]